MFYSINKSYYFMLLSKMDIQELKIIENVIFQIKNILDLFKNNV